MRDVRSLVVGDLHLNDNPRDRYRHDFQDFILGQLKRLRPNRLIYVGDFTDAKDRHSAWLVNRIADNFAAQSREVEEIICLQGNHDYLDERHPFFQFLSHIEGIRWINRPKRIGDWLFLPHTRDYETEWKGLDLKSPKMIITHNTFAGADNGFGKRLRGIPLEVIPKTATIVSGDVHYPQFMGPIEFIGAPYTINFGDDYEPHILMFDGEKRTSIEAIGPQKRVLECEVTKRLDPHAWDNIRQGDIIKVIVHLEARDVDKWPKLRADIRAWGDKHKVQVPVIRPVVRYEERRRSKGGAIKKRSDKDLVMAYGKDRGISPGVLKAGQRFVDRSPQ